jgi:DOPA 4,5-dioxygenase
MTPGLLLAMTNSQNPWHAHVYYDMESWDTAQLVHQQISEMVVTGTCAGLVLVGQMYDRGVGPHLQPQFEIQFYESAVPRITEILRTTGLTSLIHPLTDDDLADHTTLAQWIGDPLPLDVSVLDPPGHNQGIARFGHEEF